MISASESPFDLPPKVNPNPIGRDHRGAFGGTGLDPIRAKRPAILFAVTMRLGVGRPHAISQIQCYFLTMSLSKPARHDWQDDDFRQDVGTSPPPKAKFLSVIKPNPFSANSFFSASKRDQGAKA